VTSINANDTNNRIAGQQKSSAKSAALPDARLIQLCAAYTAGLAVRDEIGRRHRDDTAKDPWKEFDAAVARKNPVFAKIGRTKPRTMDGLKAMSRLALLTESEWL